MGRVGSASSLASLWRTDEEMSLCFHSVLCKELGAAKKRRRNDMSYMGVGYSGYDFRRCPLCGEGMWNGRCENPDCKHHWEPLDDDEEEEDRDDEA